MADYEALKKLLKTLAAESCLKIGLTLPMLTLNLPKDSLAGVLNVAQEELPKAMAGFQGMYEKGDVSFGSFEGNITLSLAPQAIREALAECGESGFLKELVALTQKAQSTAEDYRHLMEQYGKTVWQPSPTEEFDYLGYFVDGVPDDFRYCFHQEGQRCDYHRYTRRDYEAFRF